MYNSRKPPTAVARQLRQEAGFGCAACGSPIIEYHHIIEWHERKHHEPEHMVVLCPTCHREYGKRKRSDAYRLKSNPINIRNGRIAGYLGGNKTQKAVRMGSLRVSNGPTLLSFCGISIVGCELIDTEYQLDIFIPDQNFWPDIEIVKNFCLAKTANFWDIEFKTNWIKFKKSRTDLFLEIDFRGDDILILGDFTVGGQNFSLTRSIFSACDNKFSGLLTFENGGSELILENGVKIHRPNYAMQYPKPIIIK